MGSGDETRCNEIEQKSVDRKASNKERMARKRARDNVNAIIEVFLGKVKVGPESQK